MVRSEISLKRYRTTFIQFVLYNLYIGPVPVKDLGPLIIVLEIYINFIDNCLLMRVL